MASFFVCASSELALLPATVRTKRRQSVCSNFFLQHSEGSFAVGVSSLRWVRCHRWTSPSISSARGSTHFMVEVALACIVFACYHLSENLATNSGWPQSPLFAAIPCPSWDPCPGWTVLYFACKQAGFLMPRAARTRRPSIRKVTLCDVALSRLA